MPESKRSAEKFVSLLKDALNVLRDGALLLLFALLLLAPRWMNVKLSEAGFTKGSIAGFDWEATYDATKKAGEAVAQVDAKLGDVSDQLTEVASRVQDPAARRQVDSLASSLTASRTTTEAADRSIKASLVTQEKLAVDRPGWARPAEGWIFLGRVNERRDAWLGSGPSTIQSARPRLVPGQSLSIADDVYLRADSPAGQRAQAAVLSVLRAGERVTVTDVDYSHARAGGWFVWVRVKR